MGYSCGSTLVTLPFRTLRLAKESRLGIQRLGFGANTELPDTESFFKRGKVEQRLPAELI